jgi:hypothetical protein
VSREDGRRERRAVRARWGSSGTLPGREYPTPVTYPTKTAPRLRRSKANVSRLLIPRRIGLDEAPPRGLRRSERFDRFDSTSRHPAIHRPGVPFPSPRRDGPFLLPLDVGHVSLSTGANARGRVAPGTAVDADRLHETKQRQVPRGRASPCRQRPSPRGAVASFLSRGLRTARRVQVHASVLDVPSTLVLPIVPLTPTLRTDNVRSTKSRNRFLYENV